MSAAFRAMYEQGLAAVEARRPWPEDMIARHLTWAGEFLRDVELTADVTDVDAGLRVSAVCRGCRDRRSEFHSLRAEVFEWAASHAAACRALPRPGVA